MDNATKLRRQEEAATLLKSDMWNDAWASYRNKVLLAIEHAKTDEGTIRGKLILNIMTDVRAQFENAIKEGEFIAHEIRLDEERKKRRWFAT